jgi:hypothetical protein
MAFIELSAANEQLYINEIESAVEEADSEKTIEEKALDIQTILSKRLKEVIDKQPKEGEHNGKDYRN